jgi:hypothetical protein
VVDPRGGTWWEVEDVVASHRGPKNNRRFLVRYKGFGPAYDEWKSEHDVSPQLIKEYDELCRLAVPGGVTVAVSPVPRPARAKVSTTAASSQRTQSQKEDRDARAARRRK